MKTVNGNTSLVSNADRALRSALLVSLAFISICNQARAQDDSAAIAALQKQVDSLKQTNDLQKQALDSAKGLLDSQKGLIDSQKGIADSQTQLLSSQKSLLDAMFPQITGGKTGSLSFDGTTKIGSIAQPQAVKLVTDTIATEVCHAVQKAAADKKYSGYTTVVSRDLDASSLPLARTVQLQLNVLSDGFTDALKIPKTEIKSLAPTTGLMVYAAGDLLKQIASFTQLFRSDVTVYNAEITIDEQLVATAVAGCMLAPQQEQNTAASYVKSPQTLTTASYTKPDNSILLSSLRELAEFRSKATIELHRIDTHQTLTEDEKSKKSKLISLNNLYDTFIASLFATSEKQPIPTLTLALTGEAITTALNDNTLLTTVRLVHTGALGAKVSSIWTSDKLLTWATSTVEYTVMSSNGDIIAAGVAGKSGSKIANDLGAH